MSCPSVLSITLSFFFISISPIFLWLSSFLALPGPPLFLSLLALPGLCFRLLWFTAVLSLLFSLFRCFHVRYLRALFPCAMFLVVSVSSFLALPGPPLFLSLLALPGL